MNLIASHNALHCPIRLPTGRSRATCVKLVQQSQQPRCSASSLSSRRSRSLSKHHRSICRVAAPEQSSSAEQSDNFDALAELDNLEKRKVPDTSDEPEDDEELQKSLDAMLAQYRAEEKAEDKEFKQLLAALDSELSSTEEDLSDPDVTDKALDALLARLKNGDVGDVGGSAVEDLPQDDLEDSSDEDESAESAFADAEALGWFDTPSDEESSDDEEGDLDKYAEAYNAEDDTEDDKLLNPFFEELVAAYDERSAETDSIHSELLEGNFEDDEEEEEDVSQQGRKQIVQQFVVGDRVTGKVTRVTDKYVNVDIGAKYEARCSAAELSLAKVKKAGIMLKIGDWREFEVIRDDRANERHGQTPVLLSMRKFEEDVCWRRVQQLSDENITVLGKVTGQNEGGLTLEVENLSGFVPMSHVTSQTDTDDMEELMGSTIPVKFLEVDKERGRLVFSARKVANEKDLQAYKIGDVAEGIVQSIKPYGAFIELGAGLSGLLHISQISFDRVTNVGGVLAEGDKLKVMILSQDKDRARMSLSTKKLEPTPGDMLKDPQLVYDKAEEMAEAFRQRLAEAEATARAEGINFPDMQGYDTGSFDAGGYDTGGYGAGGYSGPYDSQSYDAQSYDSQDFPADQRY